MKILVKQFLTIVCLLVFVSPALSEPPAGGTGSDVMAKNLGCNMNDPACIEKALQNSEDPLAQAMKDPKVQQIMKDIEEGKYVPPSFPTKPVKVDGKTYTPKQLEEMNDFISKCDWGVGKNPSSEAAAQAIEKARNSSWGDKLPKTEEDVGAMIVSIHAEAKKSGCK